MQPPIRRVITTVDKDGKSTIFSDASATSIVRPLPVAPDLALINLWSTTTSPASLSEQEGPATQSASLVPSPCGTIFRFVNFPPEASYRNKVNAADTDTAWKELKTEQKQSTVHPMMHSTKTIDYAIILSGEIYLILDKTETLLKSGDVVIQRGTNHAWSNQSNAPCLIAFILIDAR